MTDHNPPRLHDASTLSVELEALAQTLAAKRNPFLDDGDAIDRVLSLNGFGANLLSSRVRDVQDLKATLQKCAVEALKARSDAPLELARLGRVLRADEHHTSWLNTEKQQHRHRIIEIFDEILRDAPQSPNAAITFGQLCETVASLSPMVTLDVRGQALDAAADAAVSTPAASLNAALSNVCNAVASFTPQDVRPLALQAVEWHDTIDPHISLPALSNLDILWRAAEAKAKERAFVFGRRLLETLSAAISDRLFIRHVLSNSEEAAAVLENVRKGVLSAAPFEDFIRQRLPSRSARLEDYVVNRHQILSDDLSIQDTCRMLIGAPENAASDWRSRKVINAFFRQVFGLGQAANVGLEARPFFIDHGYGSDGAQLDWPSYVFVPAGAIWGKGAGVDLSCGVAVGGGVDLANGCGRDASYIGGSWSATLYHGHSHVGGDQGSAGARSRDRLLHFGLTVDDGARLPWGAYIEAEDHLQGGIHRGVRTYLMQPAVH